MPSRQTRRRKQRGGAVGVVQALIAQIRNKQNDLQTAVSLVKEQELSEALETAFTSTGGGREAEADIRFYVESMLKDEKTAEDLFPNPDMDEMIPEQYAALIQAINGYSKMRNDMDSLIKSIYRYINLRLSAYTQRIGPVENVPYQNRAGRQGQGLSFLRNRRNQQGEPTEPEFSRAFGGKPSGNYSKGFGLPQFSRNFGGSNDPDQYNNSNRILRRSSLRKKH